MNGAVEVIVADPAWEREGVDWPRVACDLYARTLALFDGADELGVALLLADDATLRRLNAQFRGRDHETNVLSFAAAPGHGMLGDIAVAHGVCAREAAGQGKSFADHATHLILHGLLHLYGFDHEISEAEAAVMETHEREILAQLGIADPYIAREGARAVNG